MIMVFLLSRVVGVTVIKVLAILAKGGRGGVLLRPMMIMYGIEPLPSVSIDLTIVLTTKETPLVFVVSGISEQSEL